MREAWFWLSVLLYMAGCAESRTRGAQGGETHFLVCEQDSDCAALGAGYTCGEAGTCEPIGAAVGDEDACADGGCAPAIGATGAEVGEVGEVGEVAEDAPLVLLLVDTSGSMERLSNCDCETPGCMECEPRCGGTEAQPNRWAQVLEALTGTFEDFTCDTLARTEENGMTYDLGYYLPYHRPGRTAQAQDGVLDVFAERVRFGVATFDGMDTYLGAPPLVELADFDAEASSGEDGLWSYSPSQVISRAGDFDARLTGLFRYPHEGVSFFMDTGIRSAEAEGGALRVAVDAADAMQINAEIQDDLLGVRPFGGTPIAAALTDLDAYLRYDAHSAAERQDASRQRHVVLITDGYPDDDYRQFGCNCAAEQDPSDPDYCGGPPNDPSLIRCPYDLPEEVARSLRCGSGEACDDGIVEAVHVVGFSTTDSAVTARLEAIAAAGGSTARFASGPEDLRAMLTAVLDEILGR